MMNANDIAAHHRSRLAFIYVRQSSPHQVLHHRESQLRQRSFRQRAADLGWPLERITVIDEDLGVSATKRRPDRTGCGSAPSQKNERSTAAAMAGMDSGSSRTILV